jgi:hypothetical protein
VIQIDQTSHARRYAGPPGERLFEVPGIGQIACSAAPSGVPITGPDISWPRRYNETLSIWIRTAAPGVVGSRMLRNRRNRYSLPSK